ncbi:MAG TPA: hypothetical protein VFS75_03070 [Candidatus Paceibacterota bacterium]|nr:hypothetical protein [Candidatus Paceibacterota bacterium]
MQMLSFMSVIRRALLEAVVLTCDNVGMEGPSGIATPAVLGLGAAVAGILGFFYLNVASPVASMLIDPADRVVTRGEIFDVNVVIRSSISVNVFAGELYFDPSILAVDSIDYNTSIADLWAERPWYSNGNGTLNFAGGSTKGGFEGEGTLIKVTFRAIGEGAGVISIHDPRILKHDGLGTDAEIDRPIDAIFTVRAENGDVLTPQSNTMRFHVVKEAPSTDLNGDGRHTIADISVFLLHLSTDDERYDFNMDGRVNLEDLKIILGS